MVSEDYCYIEPRHSDLESALAVCTHLAVGAHPDDLEVMAGHGILQCINSQKNHFFGITCTTGAGSARSGEYSKLSDQQMEKLRRQEQFQSAKKGQYAGVMMLSHQSSEIKGQWNFEFLDQLIEILKKTKPKIIYTHNPFDKHLTHVSVCAHLVEALRKVGYLPKEFLGCEVWRGLDWLPDPEKVVMPIAEPERIAHLIACHKSQTEGGKDYAQATVGRMAANATFFDAREVDQNHHQLYAVDLMPLLKSPQLSLSDFGKMKVEIFQKQLDSALLPFC